VVAVTDEPLDLAPILRRREAIGTGTRAQRIAAQAIFRGFAPGDIDALAAEVVRLRAENARLRDPFLWVATWYARFFDDDSERAVILDHGNLIELDHGAGQIIFTHPDLETRRG
jgi:hypothetical protein